MRTVREGDPAGDGVRYKARTAQKGADCMGFLPFMVRREAQRRDRGALEQAFTEELMGGWEYHHRRRGRDGRFTGDKRQKSQVHLRMTEKQANVLRTLAVKEGMGLSEFVLTTIYRYYQLKKQLYTRERRKNGYQRDERGD